MSIRLSSESRIISVRVWTDYSKTAYVRGQIIGSSDGLYGVLLNNGEYIDVPEHQLCVIE
ncbi:MAG TPA: hypothetical protein IAB48_05965 [Candidatus Fimimorpha excrementavium]|uniref:SLA1 homology domain-containing protein n=1 Tax=Candidatus Enterocloster excrementipullorum TaxID=2838559 RepID=A0A9D2N1D3_9FIRM|nr:hypothetical protein [Candidatus Fimimorpha excrementavium]HJC06301.1 hypothetical protein [Candidatus Enterocloster excrementipullorum]